MKLMLVADDGQIVDSTEMTAEEWAHAQTHPAGAWTLLRELG
jgi:hypothetical protein